MSPQCAIYRCRCCFKVAWNGGGMLGGRQVIDYVNQDFTGWAKQHVSMRVYVEVKLQATQSWSKPNMSWGLIGSACSVANCVLLTIGWVVAQWDQLEWITKSLTCRSTLTCKQWSRQKTLKNPNKEVSLTFSLPPYELRVAGLESKTHRHEISPRYKNFHLRISQVLIGITKGQY